MSRISYRNPYDFVPLEGDPPRRPPPPQDRLTGLSGQIRFTVEALSPLCVNQDPARPGRGQLFAFAHLDERPTLPATSLKGMLRSVHEVVTNSTMGLLKSRDGWYRARMPAAYLPGERADQLTASETLFGMVGSGDSSVGYAGRLLLDDIPLRPEQLGALEIWRPARGGMPKPEHRSFYFDPQGRALGRKFYYHQSYRRIEQVYSGERRRASEPRKIEVVDELMRLHGALRFTGLDEAELAALVYTLVLEEGLAHKLGYGKALGLGSLRIHIKELQVERLGPGGVPARLFSYGDEETRDDWTERVPALRARARADWLARPNGPRSHAAFAAIARWQEQELFVYPDYGFFLSERNAIEKTPLWEIQGRDDPHPGGVDERAPVTSDPPRATASAPPAPEPPPVPAGPRVVLDLRPTGSFQLTPDGGGVVIGADGKRFLVTAESAERAVLRQLLERAQAGAPIRVRYRPERAKVEGKNQNVARDMEPAEEGRSG